MGNKFINIMAKAIIIIAIIFSGVLIFAVYSNAGEETKEEEKIVEEIRYIDNKLLTIINYINNIDLPNYEIVLTKVQVESNSSGSSQKGSKSESGGESSSESGPDKKETTVTKMEEQLVTESSKAEVDWNTIESETEMLYSTWGAIVLDLYKIDISNEDILSFSDTLDEAIINIKNKDKALSCMYLAKLYSHLPKFAKNNSELDEIKKETLQAKSYIINAYAYAETTNWDKIEEEISKAENIFKNLVNDVKYIEDKRKYNIDKSYILIEELKNSLKSKDTEIFYLKYKNALEELNVIA